MPPGGIPFLVRTVVLRGEIPFEGDVAEFLRIAPAQNSVGSGRAFETIGEIREQSPARVDVPPFGRRLLGVGLGELAITRQLRLRTRLFDERQRPLEALLLPLVRDLPGARWRSSPP
jgi:hypothetical protein